MGPRAESSGVIGALHFAVGGGCVWPGDLTRLFKDLGRDEDLFIIPLE